jgi:hypothetical protein
MRRIAAAAVVAIIAALLPLMGPGMAQATNVGYYICLTNSPTSCLDVKGDSYTLFQPVWIFSDAAGSGATALGWNPQKDSEFNANCDGQSSCGGIYYPFTDHALDKMYYNDPNYLLVPNITSCLALGEDVGVVELRELSENCVLGGVSNLADEWIKAGNQFINVARTNTTGTVSLLTALGSGNGATVDVLTPGSGGWTQWTISPFVN